MNKDTEIDLIETIHKKDAYIVKQKEEIEKLKSEINTIKRNVENYYISKLIIERKIEKLREKQKFNQAYALQELLQENKITDK